MIEVRRRFSLPSYLAEVVVGIRPYRRVPMTIRHRTDGPRVTAIEETPDGAVLVASEGAAEFRQGIDIQMADAIGATLPGSWGCEACKTIVEDASGNPRHATFLVSALAGFVDVAFHDPAEAAAFAPDAWMAGLAEVSGTGSYALMGGASAEGASPAAAERLGALLAPRRQQDLLLGLIARDVPAEIHATPWETVRSEARDLGMTLSADKALVRTALAPLVCGADGAVFLAGLDSHDARLLREDGLFVLRMADGQLLGAIPWSEDTGFEAGTAILGPGAPFPAALSGDVAIDLAREGYHAAPDGLRIGLWSLDRLDEVRIRLCGLSPAALSAHDGRDAFV